MFWIAALVLAGCGAPRPPSPPFSVAVPATWQSTAEGKRVLVLFNKLIPESKTLADYYASKRGIPKENVLSIHIDTGEDTNPGAIKDGLIVQVRERAKASATPIDFIVLCKGMPLRYFDPSGFGFSLDAIVSTMDIPEEKAKGPDGQMSRAYRNPYFTKDEPFSKAKYGFYLVTRLDGYSYEDAKKLVDQSLAAKPDKGPFFFDSVPNVTSDGYGQMNSSMIDAGQILAKKGFTVSVDRTPEFIRPSGPLMGYASWGSNDKNFSQTVYESIRFKPGALAETFVSTSARTLKPVSSGQSVVTDLIKNGVTGVKGYVLEPYTIALARPHILFDRYTSGYNLAESFYMASPVLHWRDVVFGDPLCRPYKK